MAIYGSEYKLSLTVSRSEYRAAIWKNDRKFADLKWPPPEMAIEDKRYIECFTQSMRYFLSNIPKGSVVTVEFKDTLQIKNYLSSGLLLRKKPNAGKKQNREFLSMWGEFACDYRFRFYQNSKKVSGDVTTKNVKKLKSRFGMAPTGDTKVMVRKMGALEYRSKSET